MKDANSQNQLSSALQSIQALTWNVKSGGFEDYSVEHEQPQRGAAIQTRHADLWNSTRRRICKALSLERMHITTSNELPVSPVQIL